MTNSLPAGRQANIKQTVLDFDIKIYLELEILKFEFFLVSYRLCFSSWDLLPLFT